MRNIYTLIPTRTHSQNSLAAAEAPSLKISSHEISLSNDYEDHPNQHKNSHKLCDEMGTSRCEFDGKSMETEATTSEFPSGGKAIVEQILASEEINKSKRVHQIDQFHQKR